MKDTFEIIHKYLDGELNKDMDIKLFTILAENEEARNYFNQMCILKNLVSQSKEEFPFELEEKIYSGISELGKKHHRFQSRIFQYIAYAAAVIFLMLSVYLFNQMVNLNNQINSVNKEIKNQNETIQLLYNCLPAAEVRANYPYEITIKSNL